MIMSVKRNILKNGIATFFLKLVRVFEQLLLVPFFLSTWGAAYYGEWLTLTIIPSIIAFSDLGFGTAAGNSFVLKYSSGDLKGAANSNKTGLRLILIMVLTGLIISVFALMAMDHFGAFEKSIIESRDAIVSVSILILARLSGFFSQLFEAYYRAVRKAALSMNLATIRSSLNLLAGFIVLMLGYGVIAFAISQLIVILIFNSCFGLYGRKLLRSFFNQYKGEFKKEERSEIISKGFGFLMGPIWQSTYFQGTTFVVRIVLGPEAVAVFNTVRTLSRSVNQLYSMVNVSVFPELQYEFGVGNIDKVKKIFRFSIISTVGIGFSGVIFLLFFGMWFYQIWTNNQISVSHIVWNIMSIGILFNAMWLTSSVIFRALNDPQKFTIFGFISAIVSIILSYLLSKYFGLVGAAFGSISLDILMAFLVLPYSFKAINLKFYEFINDCRNDLAHILKRVF